MLENVKVAQIKKFKKKSTYFLDTQVSLAPTHVSWLVGPLVTLSDFQSLVSNGRSNQKVQKTKSIYFRILLLGGPSPPTKMYMKA